LAQIIWRRTVLDYLEIEPNPPKLPDLEKAYTNHFTSILAPESALPSNYHRWSAFLKAFETSEKTVFLKTVCEKALAELTAKSQSIIMDLYGIEIFKHKAFTKKSDQIIRTMILPILREGNADYLQSIIDHAEVLHPLYNGADVETKDSCTRQLTDLIKEDEAVAELAHDLAKQWNIKLIEDEKER
jgi:hypothetical protein